MDKHAKHRINILGTNMSEIERKKLEEAATEFLKQNGLDRNGQPKDQKKTWDSTGQSVRAISTPVGGKSTWQRKKRR
jgi:hypothetical protein